MALFCSWGKAGLGRTTAVECQSYGLDYGLTSEVYTLSHERKIFTHSEV